VLRNAEAQTLEHEEGAGGEAASNARAGSLVQPQIGKRWGEHALAKVARKGAPESAEKPVVNHST